MTAIKDSHDSVAKQTIVCIPVYNEENNILDVSSKVRKYVNDVIVYDDGSTDKTAEIAESYGVEVIRST